MTSNIKKPADDSIALQEVGDALFDVLNSLDVLSEPTKLCGRGITIARAKQIVSLAQPIAERKRVTIKKDEVFRLVSDDGTRTYYMIALQDFNFEKAFKVGRADPASCEDGCKSPLHFSDWLCWKMYADDFEVIELAISGRKITRSLMAS